MNFVFVDGWTFISSEGKKLRITKKDLSEYENSGLSKNEIKRIVYSYFTSDDFLNFSITTNMHYEL